MNIEPTPGTLPVRDYLSMGVSLVGVLTAYQPTTLYRVMFRLRLMNASNTDVCLLGRKWTLRDASGNTRIIEGEKVFNETPILRPGDVYAYGGYQDFTSKPVAIELRFFGTDQSHAPFISPPLCFPRQSLNTPQG